METQDWEIADDDEEVCHCLNVSKKEIVDAIKDGATTIQDIEKELEAGTGCGGCRVDILALLKIYG